MGQKNWPYNGVAVFPGKAQFHDLRAVMTNTLDRNTPYIAFTVLFSLINNRNVAIANSN